MIGTARLLAALGIVALAPLFAGGAGPADDEATRMLVAGRARLADMALAALEADLASAVDDARVGAARVVAGTASPSEPLRAAATTLADAAPAADRARAAVAALNAAWIAGRPVASTVAEPVASGEIASIAVQIEGTADAAEAFAEQRRRAERLPERLDAALAAMAGGDLDTAEAAVADARAEHRSLAGWEVELATLPVWLETTGDLIGSVERLTAALRAGDAAAADSAGAELAALRDVAATADRALRIAIGEGGAAVTATPLSRLAGALDRVAAAREAVASILQTTGR